jgi:hypothetical protein
MKNLVVANYDGVMGDVILDAGWHEVKAFAAATTHDFIVCGTVVIVDGETVSNGSRCSERYVYYAHVNNFVVGPFDELTAVNAAIKDITHYEILRGTEFFFDYHAVPPASID